MRTLEIVLALVTGAVLVATLAGRLRAPAPSILVVAGVLVALLPGVPAVSVPPDVVSLLVLPPLLFAAATDVAPTELRAVLGSVVVLAVGLVAVTAAGVAWAVRLVEPGVALSVAFVLGAILASTDPVAVSALARRLRLPPRLLAVVQGESLFNDATSLVLFQVAVGVVVAGTAAHWAGIAGQFLWLGGGGAAVGLAVAVGAQHLHRRTDDAVLETVLALLTPYLVFGVAQALHTSGVTAVVVCGLWVSRSRGSFVRGPVRLQIAHVYATVVFLMESVVFALIGLELPGLVEKLPSAEKRFVPAALAVTAVIIVIRVLSIYPMGYLQRLRSARAHTTDGTSWRALAVLSWAGTRGVVPLAAALSIPLTTDAGRPFPERDLLLVLAISCITLTLVVQGLTLEPLVRRLDVGEDRASLDRERASARQAMVTAALERLDQIGMSADSASFELELARRELEHPDRLDPGQMQDLRLALLDAQRAELGRLYEAQDISDQIHRELQRTLDLEEARLSDDRPPA